MIMSMFMVLNELKSYIVVVDQLLETTSTAHYYKKCTNIIKNGHMQNMSFVLDLMF